MALGLYSHFTSLYSDILSQIAGFTNRDARRLVFTLLTALVVSRVFKLIRGINAVNRLPGMRVPFQPLALPGAVIPTSWWNPGIRFQWLRRSTFYAEYKNENVSIIPFISGVPCIYTSNLDIARQVIVGSHKTKFVKPESASQALLLWGMNLVAADGEMWRKHRRIIGPAFNNKLYQLVWVETLNTYREMVVAEGWDTKNTIEVSAIQKFTFKLALLIIGKCGFGFSFDWTSPPEGPDGKMTLQAALRTVADSVAWSITFPKWVFKLPFRKLREIGEAHDQLMGFMRAQVTDRKGEVSGQVSRSEGKGDIFTMLVEANEDDTGKHRLGDDELIGNVFIMLFAGHETTAHTLAASLGYLALHENIQDEVLEHIVSVIGWDRDPTFDDYSKLNKVISVFYESLRMFPSGYLLIREATEDTVIQVPNPVGQEGTTPFPVPKGMQFVVDMVGVQWNPRYFDEPEKFKPSRWYELPSESEVFSAFSIGARACIGRRFATTEAVAFLTMIIRDWKFEPVFKIGETKEAWRKRAMDARIGITLGISDVPIRFTKRDKGRA